MKTSRRYETANFWDAGLRKQGHSSIDCSGGGADQSKQNKKLQEFWENEREGGNIQRGRGKEAKRREEKSDWLEKWFKLRDWRRGRSQGASQKEEVNLLFSVLNHRVSRGDSLGPSHNYRYLLLKPADSLRSQRVLLHVISLRQQTLSLACLPDPSLLLSPECQSALRRTATCCWTALLERMSLSRFLLP